MSSSFSFNFNIKKFVFRGNGFFCSCNCKGEILVILGIWDKMVSKALYQVPQNLLKIKLY